MRLYSNIDKIAKSPLRSPTASPKQAMNKTQLIFVLFNGGVDGNLNAIKRFSIPLF